MLSAIKNIANQSTTDMDMSVAAKGGEKYLLPEGVALGRLIEYIEFGKQPQEYKGEKKDPCMEIQLGFALYGEGYQKDDGKPRMISTYRMKLSNNEKAKSFKLFGRMNAKRTAKNFAQLLGEPFLVPVVHQSNAKGTYARIDLDNIGYAIDPIKRTVYDVPMPPEEMYRVFLWNHPSKEMWDSIYIEKNNFLQETCLSATDFPNSPLERMLKGSMPSLESKDTFHEEEDNYEDVPF